jgi:hypothetical protein
MTCDQQKANVMQEIFESSTRTCGDLVAVFECDEGGAFFYLFDLTGEKKLRARAVIEVSEPGATFEEADVSVSWNASEDIAGLCIRGDLWAAFDRNGRGYGGNYGTQRSPRISSDVSSRFFFNSRLGLPRGENAQAAHR